MRFWTWIDELSTSENGKSVEDGIHRMGRVVEVGGGGGGGVVGWLVWLAGLVS